MHPAYSVILFTTASGAGYGLACWLVAGALLGLVPVDAWTGGLGFGAALSLIGVGFASSTFHLGHPERAWRALSQWRTSWLSREGVLAFVSLSVIAGAAASWVFTETLPIWLGLAVLVVSVATVACTAMIYASLKTIQRWSNAWVVPGYLVLALATGGVLANLLAELRGIPAGFGVASALAVLAAGFIKQRYWAFIDSTASSSTVASATGLGAGGTVRLFEAPHTEENYLMREMGFRVARKHADKLRQVALLGLALVPAIASLATQALDGIPGLALAAAAFGSVAVGVLVERWLFFAEARHTVTLYYGAEQV
jgi:DMSO reductase anchor subunit